MFFSVLTLATNPCRGQQQDYHGVSIDPVVISLWDSVPPFASHPGPEKYLPSREDSIKRLTNVSNPTITVYGNNFLNEDAPNRPAVIICPGGGYNLLAMNLEGTEVASWLCSLGIRPILLKYRVPKNPEGAFADAQRAMSILRSCSSQLHINPRKIGIIGFSAGGHLAARMSTHFSHRIYDPVDQNDTASLRPDFCILIYPAYLVNKEGKLSKEVAINKNTPPTFLTQTQDDPIGYKNSLFYYNALTQYHIPAQLNLFAQGAHGYGLRTRKINPLSTWPKRCAKWLNAIGILP